MTTTGRDLKGHPDDHIAPYDKGGYNDADDERDPDNTAGRAMKTKVKRTLYGGK